MIICYKFDLNILCCWSSWHFVVQRSRAHGRRAWLRVLSLAHPGCLCSSRRTHHVLGFMSRRHTDAAAASASLRLITLAALNLDKSDPSYSALQCMKSPYAILIPLMRQVPSFSRRIILNYYIGVVLHASLTFNQHTNLVSRSCFSRKTK